MTRLLAEWFPEFAKELDDIDEFYKKKRLIDEKTYQFICFALAIKGHSAPCVRKHFKGALEAGATVKELTYIMALVFRESAGNDDCWVHDILSDYKELMKGNVQCCPK
ncbi:MAG TPA: carboxymuconolactone decarboxylase family protein [Candidatus Thermoplasmatota archaeon]|nr:carboxymuconolactone decarboxylase family protein [Candidatus Thermoplasmatota archaeon]